MRASLAKIFEYREPNFTIIFGVMSFFFGIVVLGSLAFIGLSKPTSFNVGVGVTAGGCCLILTLFSGVMAFSEDRRSCRKKLKGLKRR